MGGGGGGGGLGDREYVPRVKVRCIRSMRMFNCTCICPGGRGRERYITEKSVLGELFKLSVPVS